MKRCFEQRENKELLDEFGSSILIRMAVEQSKFEKLAICYKYRRNLKIECPIFLPGANLIIEEVSSENVENYYVFEKDHFNQQGGELLFTRKGCADVWATFLKIEFCSITVLECHSPFFGSFFNFFTSTYLGWLRKTNIKIKADGIFKTNYNYKRKDGNEIVYATKVKGAAPEDEFKLNAIRNFIRKFYNFLQFIEKQLKPEVKTIGKFKWTFPDDILIRRFSEGNLENIEKYEAAQIPLIFIEELRISENKFYKAKNPRKPGDPYLPFNKYEWKLLSAFRSYNAYSPDPRFENKLILSKNILYDEDKQYCRLIIGEDEKSIYQREQSLK